MDIAKCLMEFKLLSHMTWDVENMLVIKDDLPDRDLGYPASI